MGAAREVVEELEAVSSADPAEIRAKVVEALGRRLTSASPAFYRVIVTGDGPRFDFRTAMLPPVLPQRFRSFGARWHSVASFAPILDPGRQRPSERRAFVPYGAIVNRRRFEQTWFYNEFLRPEGWNDQIRLLVFDGRRFVGWAGLLGKGRFTQRERRALHPLVKPVQSLLTLADRLERSSTPEHAGDLVCTADGCIQHASKHARAWLEVPGFEAFLRTAVRAFDRGEPSPPSVFGESELRVLRLDGSGGVRYLVTVRPISRLEVAPLFWLPPTLRAVATRLANGDSDKEIAVELDLPLATARTYVSRVMRRLQVNSRSKVAAALGCSQLITL